jgi:hypothetical protein
LHHHPVLFQTDPRKAENFDDQFRLQPVKNTKVTKDGKYILENMNGDEFKGFSFLNDNYMVFEPEPNLLAGAAAALKDKK